MTAASTMWEYAYHAAVVAPKCRVAHAGNRGYSSKTCAPKTINGSHCINPASLLDRLLQQNLKASGIQGYVNRQNKPFGRPIPTCFPNCHRGFCIDAAINERRVENKDDLVPRLSLIDEAILEYTESDGVPDFKAKLFSNLAMKCFLCGLAELHSTAERTKKPFVLYIVVARSGEDAISVTEDADGDMSNVAHKKLALSRMAVQLDSATLPIYQSLVC
jgi:hypothetical protein